MALTWGLGTYCDSVIRWECVVTLLIRFPGDHLVTEPNDGPRDDLEVFTHPVGEQDSEGRIRHDRTGDTRTRRGDGHVQRLRPDRGNSRRLVEAPSRCS